MVVPGSFVYRVGVTAHGRARDFGSRGVSSRQRI